MRFEEILPLLKQGKRAVRQFWTLSDCVFAEGNNLYIGDLSDECYTEMPTEYTLQQWIFADDWKVVEDE